MIIPIYKQQDYLIVSIQASFTDRDWLQLQTDLLEQVGQYRSKGVIIDVTAVIVIDSFSTRILSGVAKAIKLRGAETVIVGIQPEVAFAMVQLNLLLKDVVTLMDLEDGLAYLNKNLNADAKHET